MPHFADPPPHPPHVVLPLPLSSVTSWNNNRADARAPGLSTLFSVNKSSTAVQTLSAIKLVAGLSAFIAPAFFSARAYRFKGLGTNTSTVVTTSTGEGAVSARMLGSRDVAVGLLLRDASSAVVARALQVSVLTDALDLAAAAWGYFEGSLSQEVALSVSGVAAVTGAFSLYILNA